MKEALIVCDVDQNFKTEMISLTYQGIFPPEKFNYLEFWKQTNKPEMNAICVCICSLFFEKKKRERETFLYAGC